MSTDENPSLSTLPVELVYRIFGYLDTRTIVRSIRCVCKQLYKLVNTYNQFDLDFKSILKIDFIFLCNYISPENVISLTLSDNDQTPGQIQYFLSLFRLNQFSQLRSLTLIEIDDCYLSIIVKDIQTSSLNSLTIHSERDYLQQNTSPEDLSLVLSLSTLRKIDLNIPTFDLSRLSWPIECSIQHLEIDCRTVNDYYTIVQHLPNLRRFVVRQLNEKMNDETISNLDNLESFGQLYSLTLKSCSIDMFILQLLLSLTPSIEDLQLIRCIDLNEFISHSTEWETFLQSKLPRLNKLQFFLIDDGQVFANTLVNTELILNSFRTPFWIEKKKWFVICDYIIPSQMVILYTPSFFDPQFEYVYHSKPTSRSTSSLVIDNPVIMDEVKKMYLNLESVMHLATSTQGGLPIDVVFPQIEELRLHIGNQWPLGSLRFLSTLINLSQLVKLSLEIDNSFNLYSESTVNINQLFKLAKNIRSLYICISSGFTSISDHNMQICSLIPDHVRHLTISVSTTNQMQMVFRQLKCRSSIRFEYRHAYYNASDMHMAWLESESGYDTYRLSNYSLSIWFDNHINTMHRND